MNRLRIVCKLQRRARVVVDDQQQLEKSGVCPENTADRAALLAEEINGSEQGGGGSVQALSERSRFI